MTKKDFELIARVLREEILTAEAQGEAHGALALAKSAEAFARALRATNPRLDSERFVAACLRGSLQQIVNEIIQGELSEAKESAA